MAKQVAGQIKLQVPAGKATPGPPVGPALGQRGVNSMEFCKAFNERTKAMEEGLPIPVVLTVYNDKSFAFVLKSPPASYLLKKAAGVSGGSPTPNTEKKGKIARRQAEEIARMKQDDLTAADLDSAVRTVIGTARSMGIEVEDA